MAASVVAPLFMNHLAKKNDPGTEDLISNCNHKKKLTCNWPAEGSFARKYLRAYRWASRYQRSQKFCACLQLVASNPKITSEKPFPGVAGRIFLTFPDFSLLINTVVTFLPITLQPRRWRMEHPLKFCSSHCCQTSPSSLRSTEVHYAH